MKNPLRTAQSAISRRLRNDYLEIRRTMRLIEDGYRPTKFNAKDMTITFAKTASK